MHLEGLQWYVVTDDMIHNCIINLGERGNRNNLKIFNLLKEADRFRKAIDVYQIIPKEIVTVTEAIVVSAANQNGFLRLFWTN